METTDSVGNSAIAGANTVGVDPCESNSSSPSHQLDTDRDSASSAQGSDSQQLRSVATSSSLLVRLLFLFVSSSWDEAHFRDEFWLPLFFDVSRVAGCFGSEKSIGLLTIV